MSLYADEMKADLIALGPSDKNLLDALVLGSLSRALTSSAPCSLLLTRSAPRRPGKLFALIATDHSTYFDRCFHKFLAMAPQGIEQAVVLHVITNSEAARELELVKPGHFSRERRLTPYEEASSANFRIAEHLESLGIHARSVIADGHPNEVIGDTLEGFEADLLVLGAAGHGLVERLLLGSVSARQVAVARQSVLLLRV